MNGKYTDEKMFNIMKEMQIKTIMGHHSISNLPVRMAKIKKTDYTKCCQGCEASGTCNTALSNVK